MALPDQKHCLCHLFLPYITSLKRITTLINDNETLIAISSGYAYHYLTQPRSIHKQRKELKDEGVELVAALNSAKGFLFGLKNALGNRVVEKVEELKREYYDDEIYVDTNDDEKKSKEAKEIEQALEAISDNDNEQLEVERKIRPKGNGFKMI